MKPKRRVRMSKQDYLWDNGIKVMHLVKLEEIPGAKEELKKIRKRFYDWMKDPSAFSE